MRVLILGSKEYPLGTNKGYDPAPSGGIEAYVDRLAPELAKGVDVTVVTRLFPGTEREGKIGRVSVVRVPFVRGFFLRNPLFNFNAFLKGLSLDFDVVVANDVIASWFGLLLARLRRKPFAAVYHGFPSEQPQYNVALRFLLSLLERVYKWSDVTVVQTEYQLDKVRRKLGKGRFAVIKPGLDTSRLRKDLSLKGNYSGYRIVFVNRLIKVKGLEYLLRALKGLPFEYTCIVVGDGPQRKEYESLARRLGVNAVFTGFREDVNRFLSIADVFVLPSLSESLSYSMLEAMHMGVPCIVTGIGIASEKEAVIVPARDAKALATALITRPKARPGAKQYAGSFGWGGGGKEFVARCMDLL
ncbi:MAG: glycosyltransferase family 4 protein [Candidatus Diapherotrites archaeon]|nr:glycosyltransferase family 4 protein [Candidatus Diapherotrites archaeon]